MVHRPPEIGGALSPDLDLWDIIPPGQIVCAGLADHLEGIGRRPGLLFLPKFKVLEDTPDHRGSLDNRDGLHAASNHCG